MNIEPVISDYTDEHVNRCTIGALSTLSSLEKSLEKYRSMYLSNVKYNGINIHRFTFSYFIDQNWMVEHKSPKTSYRKIVFLTKVSGRKHFFKELWE